MIDISYIPRIYEIFNKITQDSFVYDVFTLSIFHQSFPSHPEFINEKILLTFDQI